MQFYKLLQLGQGQSLCCRGSAPAMFCILDGNCRIYCNINQIYTVNFFEVLSVLVIMQLIERNLSHSMSLSILVTAKRVSV